MNCSARALALLAVWIAALAGLGLFAARELRLGADLRLFLPNASTPEQALLLEEIGEGPAARVLVLALSGGTQEELADASRVLADALRADPRFRFIANGERSLDALPPALLPYRYLLSDSLEANALDQRYLSSQLAARAQDLASPAGAVLEPLLPRDPTLEVLQVLEQWRSPREPRREFDVWFDERGEQALLLAETHAAAFDPAQQRLAIEALRDTFASIDQGRRLDLYVSGSGQFSVLIEARTRGDAQRLGALASTGMVLLLLAAYRRAGVIVLSALPLISGALAGLAVVSALFGEVHGITLAFGFTLIGVAQDYPIHLLSHQGAGSAPFSVVRRLWPTLATGVASTCIAYAAFWFSGVNGLQQLACFTVAGLAAAALTTRFVLPALIDPQVEDRKPFAALARLQAAFDRAPHPRWLIAALLLACIAAFSFGDQPFWQNDLSKLTPVPADLLSRDQQLREQLGAPDVRYLLAVKADSEQAALEQLEALDAQLTRLVSQGAVAGYDHAARYVPSMDTQRRRQARLPEESTLRADLAQALAHSPFRPDAFEAFIADVAHARTAPPLTRDALRNTSLAAALDGLLRISASGATALITFSGVRDPAALRELAGPSIALIDLKTQSEELVAAQRERIVWSLAWAAALLIAVVTFALRRVERIARVLAPMLLTTLVVLATLHGAGVSLTLFHLIALILAAGLGLDYALFFEHAAEDQDEQLATLHAVLVCSISTLLVFALLASSSLPVLRSIGATVTLGVASNFILAMVLTRRRIDQPRLASLIPHQGGMCLLDRIIEWNADRIVLESGTHRSASHPLRVEGRLRAVHLCEYGAQAMAVHGALRAEASGASPAPGMLVSLRQVRFSRDYIEDLPDKLVIEAHCLQSSESTLQYGFRVLHAGELIAEGRAAVMLNRS